MDNLDKVRARQKSESEKRMRKEERAGAKAFASASGSTKKVRRRKKRSRLSWFFTTLKILFLIVLAAAIGVGAWVFSMIDFTFGDDLSSMNLNISSKVYYTDANGDAVQYSQFVASENRVWVPISKMPNNLKNAFVAIEDQRFYKHSGVDLKRTAGAAINHVLTGDSSYGGSTITQQLVKNITLDRERTSSRKIREILRALVLETKLSKEQILELYMNTIYLSQGTNGVEAAANVYFSKSVSELTLAECACIAGITQYPTKYDPITQPEANKEKRELVLSKMLELEYISKAEYDEAISEEIKINPGKTSNERIQSYFLDHLFEELQQDLVEEKGYTPEFASNMIYNGGLKIYATVEPAIQNTMEDYFEDESNFPASSGDARAQAAMVISDPYTGEVKGIMGGVGEKDRNRGLNRATQTKRQPGSSIKPLAVYAPAVDLGLVTPSTYVDDSPLDIGGWKPKNSGGGFRGYVSVKTALTYSYNIPAVRILEEVGVDRSFEYLRDKLHITTLVDSKNENGGYSDRSLASLALGGFTEGVTVMEINNAYCALANGGEYIEHHTYTKVYDVEGKLILNKNPERNRAFKESTAFIVSNMLENVVTSGTGAGAKIDGMDTCGKTGTTDDSKDRWFVGYTPYLCGAVWYGYDSPRSISASGNPALKIWDNIMTKLHKDLPDKEFKQPDSVVEKAVCTRTGHAASAGCSVATQFADKKFSETKCTSEHKYIGTKPYYVPSDEEDDDDGERTVEDALTEITDNTLGLTGTTEPVVNPEATLEEVTSPTPSGSDVQPLPEPSPPAAPVEAIPSTPMEPAE